MPPAEISRALGVINIMLLDLFIIPGLAICSTITNIVCIAVSIKLGKNSFRACILCYSVLNIIFSINNVNFVGLTCIYHSSNGNPDSFFVESGSLCLKYEMFVICFIQKIVFESCYLMICFLPVVIVVERFIAVYMPLRMSEIITIKRTLCFIFISVGVFLTYNFIFFYNEYEIKRIQKDNNTSEDEKHDFFIFLREGKIERLNYIWLTLMILILVITIGSYIGVLIKMYKRNTVLFRNAPKSRNAKLAFTVFKINMGYLLLDLSVIMRVILDFSSSNTDKQIKILTGSDRIFALSYCSLTICTHLLLYFDFRKEFVRMFSFCKCT